MRKASARAFCAFVCFAMLFSFAMPLSAEGAEVSSNVSITITGFEIVSKTEDCVIQVGDDLGLMISVSGTVSAYKWERSSNGGTSWTQVATTATYAIVDAQQNTPPNLPYQYRVTVTNDTGASNSVIISVLVSDEYTYRTVSLTNGDVEVSGYIHDQTTLSVTPLSEGSTEAVALKAAVSSGKLPFCLYNISLTNSLQPPYHGTPEVSFLVGSAYNGQTLTVYQLTGGGVVTYTGVVSGGVLSVTVNELTQFMVGVPTAGAHIVTVNVGAGGTVTPFGTVYAAHGSSRTFSISPNAGYDIKSVTLDGSAVIFTGGSYTLSNIMLDHTLNVSFKQVIPTSPTTPTTPTTPTNQTTTPNSTTSSTSPSPTPTSIVIPITGEQESITATAEIVGNSAEITVDDDALAELLSTDTAAETITIDVSEIKSDINSVVIPVSVIQTVANQAASDDGELNGMDVVMPHGAVTFDAGALDAISEQAKGDTVKLRVEVVDTESLAPEQKTALKDVPENSIVVEVALESGGASISDFLGGSAEIRLPYTPQDGEDTETITVWFVAQDGTMQKIPCRYEDGFVIFTVQHFSNYLIKPGIIEETDAEPVAPEPSPDNKNDLWIFLAIAVAIGAAVWRRLRKRGENME